jgi:hypothetical protein
VKTPDLIWRENEGDQGGPVSADKVPAAGSECPGRLFLQLLKTLLQELFPQVCDGIICAGAAVDKVHQPAVRFFRCKRKRHGGLSSVDFIIFLAVYHKTEAITTGSRKNNAGNSGWRMTHMIEAKRVCFELYISGFLSYNMIGFVYT